MRKNCSRCESSFECKTQPIWWCMFFPPLPIDMEDDSDCMCKKCLAKTYFERIFEVA